MKIGVTIENGEIFQHFGHTEQFKIYEVEDGKVVSSEIAIPMEADMAPWRDFFRSVRWMR